MVQYKCLENFNENEMKETFISIPNYKVEICYKYLHKERYIKAETFASNNCISVATLYRYVREVREAYNKMTKEKNNN